MNPIQAPQQWPPPAEPPPSADKLKWTRWPIVGIVLRLYFASRRRSHHTWHVLKPIEEQIVAQLVGRNGNTEWQSELHAEIAGLISHAIAEEKSIEQPTIHPDDRFDLLFWGAYDDMTPLVFSLAFHDRFQINVTSDDMLQFYEQQRTIGEFVGFCVGSVNRQAENAA